MSTIDVLKQKMFEDDAAAAAQRVAIVGLGGVGKTQVALQMAYWTRQNKPDWSVFWVPLLSKETFEQAYRQIAQLVGLEEADKADIKFSVQRYLQSKESGRWLLIVDNADDEQVVFGDGKGMSGINEFLPQSDCGRFLLTTRLQRIATRFARGDVVELSKMEKSEAHAFLEKSLVDKTLLREADKVAKLLETLTYLPLAIIQAVSYLNENKESIDEYIRLLGKTEQDMVELLTTEFADDTRYGNTPNAVANTWVVSFEQIRKDADAAEILLFMAYIEPKAIPRSMLPEVGSEQRMTRAIGLLCGYSFLSRRKDEQLYDMHRLVHIASQLWVKRRVDAEKRRRTALEHLVTIFQTDKWEDRQRWQQYMPHVLKAIERSREEGEWQREERYLGYWMGRCLGAEGRIGEAVNLLEHVVAVDEGTLPDSDPVRLVSQHVLAVAYLEHGRVKDAISLLVHVVAAKETLEESNPNQLASQTMLAEAYLGDGRVKEAISLLELVVTAGAILRESHPDRLVSQHLLARAYLAYGRVKEAISLLELVVTARAILRESHPDRLMSQNDLAGAYLGYGRVKEAMNLLEKVVSVCKTTLAESHSVRLVSHNMLAMIYLTNGRVKEATNMLEYVVAVRRKTLLESHPVLLVSQDGLARAYVKSGRVKEAIDLLKEVVAVRRRTQAESHPDRQTSERRLAQVIEACS